MKPTGSPPPEPFPVATLARWCNKPLRQASKSKSRHSDSGDCPRRLGGSAETRAVTRQLRILLPQPVREVSTACWARTNIDGFGDRHATSCTNAIYPTYLTPKSERRSAWWNGFYHQRQGTCIHVHPFGRASPSVINRLIKAGSLLSTTSSSRDIRTMPSVPQAATPMKPRANLGNRTLVESLTWCDYRHGIVPRCLSGLRWPLKERSVNKGHVIKGIKNETRAYATRAGRKGWHIRRQHLRYRER